MNGRSRRRAPARPRQGAAGLGTHRGSGEARGMDAPGARDARAGRGDHGVGARPGTDSGQGVRRRGDSGRGQGRA